MNRSFFLFFIALAVGLFLAGMANGYPLTAALNSMQVIPATNSAARGSCKVDFFWDDYSYSLSFELTCDFSGMSGPLQDADIRDASAGANGSSVCFQGKHVTVTLPNNGSGTATIRCEDPFVFSPPFATKQFYVVLQTSDFPDGEIRGQIKPAILDGDVDGEGRTEVSVFRPSTGLSYAFCTMDNSTIFGQVGWAPLTDSTPFLADLDGDAIADWAFTRTDPGNGLMSVLFRASSHDNQLWSWQWGNANFGDMHLVGDYDGNGTLDLAVFRSSNGNWYSTAGPFDEHWGQTGDTPAAGDYDGDAKTDLCVVRMVDDNLVWYIRRSWDNQQFIVPWGLSTDTIYPRTPVDVDRDLRNDILVSRVENGQRAFYALRSSDNSLYALQWGLSTDAVKLGDYDNDGTTDFAAIREIDGQLVWFIHQSSDGQMRVNYWGLPGDN